MNILCISWVYQKTEEIFTIYTALISLKNQIEPKITTVFSSKEKK